MVIFSFWSLAQADEPQQRFLLLVIFSFFIRKSSAMHALAAQPVVKTVWRLFHWQRVMSAFSLTHQRLFFKKNLVLLSWGVQGTNFHFYLESLLCTETFPKFFLSQLPLVVTVCHLSYKQLLVSVLFAVYGAVEHTKQMSECIGLGALHSSFILEHPARLKSSQLQCNSELLGLILYVSARLISWPVILSSATAFQNGCVSVYRTSQTSSGDAWCSGSFSPSCCHGAVLTSLVLMILF